MTTSQDRNTRRRARSARRRVLLGRLLLQVQLAFESNRSGRESNANEHLHRMLPVLLELLNEKLNNTKREALVRILHESAYWNPPIVEWNPDEDQNVLRIEGTIDLGEISKHVVWGKEVPKTLEL